MNHASNIDSESLSLLNKIASSAMLKENNVEIITDYTNAGINILKADFGFAWGKFNNDSKFGLVYKSQSSPDSPVVPRKKKKETITKSKDCIFDGNVKKGIYENDIDKYLKSYIIIPIYYGDHGYGHIVLGYKKQKNFTDADCVLVTAIGNSAAQAVTLRWFIESERKALALAEKQKATEILLDQEKVKTEFVANATHELRTPLAIMKGNVDLVQGGIKSPKEALKDINNEITHLSSIFSDLALLTAPKNHSAGRVKFTNIDIVELINQTADRVRNLAYRKKISILVKKSHPINILGTRKHLEKLFVNIIKNAVAYGKNKGKIEIIFKETRDNVTIKIKDNGIGISKQDLPHIFERFYRAEKSHTGSHSGLGLAIAKWLTEVHNGTIEAKSTEGVGTTFIVTLPKGKKQPK